MEFFSFFSFVLLLLCLGYSCFRSWLFDTDLVHELALVVFLIIKHPSLLGCGWFSPLAFGYGVPLGATPMYCWYLFVADLF
jgi:hypothetical protein